jgi:hypothetical protein
VIVSIALLVGIGRCVDSIFCEVISMAFGEKWNGLTRTQKTALPVLGLRSHG